MSARDLPGAAVRYPLRWLFALNGPVSRREYLAWGCGLMALKLGVELLVAHWLTGAWPELWLLVAPSAMWTEHWHGSQGGLWLFGIWSLPFAWIGCVLSARRGVSAGFSPWVGLWFLAPFLNALVVLVLAVAPPAKNNGLRPHGLAARLRAAAKARRATLASGDDAAYFTEETHSAEVASIAPPLGKPSSWPAVIVGALVAVAITVVAVMIINTYGLALFVLAPVAVGVVSAVVQQRGGSRPLGEVIAVGQYALLLAMLSMLSFGLEGVLCLAMAWPLAAPLTLLGSVFGRALAEGFGPASTRDSAGLMLLAVLAAGGVAWDERHDAPPLTEVLSVVEVDAPPETVWARVVSFPDLPPPTGVFATGIAAPLRATIDGAGVGAIRRCEFTTGAFVEPITAWEPPRRLAFDVASQPPTMREWSPYDIHPPHLDGVFLSRRGEFRLSPLPGGRTRLEGRTWYQVAMAPGWYWQCWGDGLIHAIHRRVLEHIARVAAADRR